MYCRAHKTATLTPIQHTVPLGPLKQQISCHLDTKNLKINPESANVGIQFERRSHQNKTLFGRKRVMGSGSRIAHYSRQFHCVQLGKNNHSICAAKGIDQVLFGHPPGRQTRIVSSTFQIVQILVYSLSDPFNLLAALEATELVSEP